MKKTSNHIDIEENDTAVCLGSGNIFADIGCSNPDDMMVKSKLVMQIEKEIKTRGLTQAQASKLIGIPQPKISKIFNGNFRDISEDKLFHCLKILGYDVNISIKKHSERDRQDNTVTGYTTLSFA
jgi:predicted XRE-type DNA-binding protein